MFPDFIGIGAARCGTTSVHAFLHGHPEAFVPERKELHFFSLGRIGSPHCRIRTAAEYASYFEGSDCAQVRGEISPSYLWIPGTAQAIKKLLPNVKLLVMLRDPVERAISDFQYSWKNGLNRRPFDEFVRKGMAALRAGHLEAQPFHPSAILWKGLYAQQLKEYLGVFSSESLGVFLLEDLRQAPATIASDICRFLGLPSSDAPSISHTNRRPSGEPVDRKIRAQLRDFYKPSVQELGSLLGRPLDEWSNFASAPEEAA